MALALVFIATSGQAILIDDTDKGGQTGATVGADIDAVGAIITRRVTTDVPAPSAIYVSILMFMVAVRARRSRK
ncbi:hypothetical protein RS130_13385 [Paraglaciecola aquimarina]|uniref:PEP-CTERM protein-sorting domain-containing protein n=1 Tax=Paraglaciecola aquimarina TaxID=1235557 RepID=A0ABU3SXN4_9ALTE|nr:hypothetical protein [Paraglaciecola aquimarina]MDU0354779.1 hypothetical protein [Paraglaciecola aquimarina]